jgi:hypothetical protein
MTNGPHATIRSARVVRMSVWHQHLVYHVVLLPLKCDTTRSTLWSNGGCHESLE